MLVTGLGLALLILSSRPGAGPLPAREALVFPGVTVIEPGGPDRSDRTIHVRDGRIESVSGPVERPRSTRARVLEEYSGAFVMPGLVDMHVHYWSAEPELFGLLLLAHGVTTVRDAGDSEGTIFATRRRIDGEEIPGPRIFACGPILDGADPVWPGSIGVTGENAARRAVHLLARRGADCVKAYHGLTPPVLDAVRRAAREAGLPLIGHVPASVPLERAGLADVQHLSGVPGRGADPDMPFHERVEAWSEAWHALRPERIDAVARAAAADGVAHTPTLVFWERLFRLRGVDPRIERALPRWHRELFWDPSRPWNRTPEDDQRHREALRRMKDVVAALHHAGVRIHAGTDTLNPFVAPGASLHAEIRHLIDAGLSTADALAAATRIAAGSLGRPELGRIAGGGPADFVIYRRNPMHDPRALAIPDAVVVRGRLWTRTELERRIAAYSSWFEAPAVDLITSAAARLGARLHLLERRL